SSFSCDWEKTGDDASLYECRGEGLILMTGSKQEVDSFVNTLRGESGMSGKALVGKGFTLLTASDTHADQAKSDHGTGEIVPVDGPAHGRPASLCDSRGRLVRWRMGSAHS